MTKRQLLRARRPKREGRRKLFRGWFWENPLRQRQPGELVFVGKCRNKQGIMLLIPFLALPREAEAIPPCRHCGGEYESVRRA